MSKGLKKSVLLSFLVVGFYMVLFAQARLQMVDADHAAFSYFGRTDQSDPKAVRLDWSPLMANVLKWSYSDTEIRFSPEY